MATVKSKGSIILEILIVLLIVALVATIMYPKMLWDKAEKEMVTCHTNMDKILKAELVYLKYHNNYEDTLDKVISFILSDTTGRLKIEYIYADTALADQILKDVTKKIPAANEKIENYLADTLLSSVLITAKFDTNLAISILRKLENTSLKDSILVARESTFSDVDALDRLHKRISANSIFAPLSSDDSLKLVLQRLRPEIAIGSLIDSLYKNEIWATQIDSAINANFESIKLCPTNLKSYQLIVIDTSAIKILKIMCPIDSLEIKNAKKDFVKYFFGHLRLENHGSINGGEKSWLK